MLWKHHGEIKTYLIYHSRCSRNTFLTSTIYRRLFQNPFQFNFPKLHVVCITLNLPICWKHIRTRTGHKIFSIFRSKNLNCTLRYYKMHNWYLRIQLEVQYGFQHKSKEWTLVFVDGFVSIGNFYDNNEYLKLNCCEKLQANSITWKSYQYDKNERHIKYWLLSRNHSNPNYFFAGGIVYF